MIEGAVCDALLADDAVQAATGGRVRPDKALQSDKLPYLCVVHAATNSIKTFGGQASAANDKVTLDIFAATKAAANRIGRAADAAMVGDPTRTPPKVGLRGKQFGRLKVQAVFSDDAQGGVIPSPHADDNGRWNLTLDYTVHYALVAAQGA